MSTVETEVKLDAGGLLVAGTKVDTGATEQVVARAYQHPALGGRPVVRLTSDRLGEAEDLAMEFLGFAAPEVSPPLAIQRRRSLGFAAWALINDPGNARFALDLVKRMKGAARLARSKPGHAWDAYTEMSKDLGRSAPHFLPPFWEDAGRAFKDLGNPTYAGRALTKSLEAERVHALAADRARRRDVVLEFVLSGCLAGSALSQYGTDLQGQYPPGEAYAIFRDLCVRRTRGGMSPWATLPKDLIKLAKAAGLDGNAELEAWLEELIDTPALGRPPLQFWKSCSPHCKRIVARNPAFAVALLRHTRPEDRYYGESKIWPWLDLLEEWGVLEFLWKDEYKGAPPLGEPIAEWFGRVVRDEVPAPKRTLELLEKLAPRLKTEATPLPLWAPKRYGTQEVDIDVLETCLAQGIKISDLPEGKFSLTFGGWLASNPDHPFRNQDIVQTAKDERFRPALFPALNQALTCRGGSASRGYRRADLEQRAFPLAAGDRPGIKALWHEQASKVLLELEESGLASFQIALERLASTLWPDTLRLFPDIAERLGQLDSVGMLQRTLQAGIFDEYGLPVLEQTADQHKIDIKSDYNDQTIHSLFPKVVLSNKSHAYVIDSDTTVKEHEIRLPKKASLISLVAVGDDLAVIYRDETYMGHFFWTSNPAQQFETSAYGHHFRANPIATVLEDGSIFLGQQAIRPGDKQIPEAQAYLHDGTRFWRVTYEYSAASQEFERKVAEVDPQTGKLIRESVPPWFEEAEGGTVNFRGSELLVAPKGAEASPLGVKEGQLGWKAVKRSDGSFFGVGIDGRRWDQPLRQPDGSFASPVALLNQPGTENRLPVSSGEGRGDEYCLWDPTGTTIIARLNPFGHTFARGQVVVLPLPFWHFLKMRDEASSRVLRSIRHEDCSALFLAATEDRTSALASNAHLGLAKELVENPLTNLLAAVKKQLPKAPERMALGVARMVEMAEVHAARLNELRDKAATEAAGESSSSTAVVNRASDLAAARWNLQEYRSYGEDESTSVSTHLQAAMQFLKGDAKPGNLPKTEYGWFPMLDSLPLRCWQTYWSVQGASLSKKDGATVPWLEFLKLWQELAISELPGQFAIMEGVPEGAKKRSWGGYDVEIESGEAFGLEQGDDRFIVMENSRSYDDDRFPYLILRYSTGGEPGPPPGIRVKNVRKLKSEVDSAAISAFIAAAESSTTLPVPTPKELEEIGKRLAVSPAEVALVWIGGLNLDSYEHNFLPSDLRKAIGLKANDANVARQALRNLEEATRDHLYAAVVAGGAACPFAEDRGLALKHLEDAWRAKTPKRLPLEAALQTRLSALSKTSRWQRTDHGELLAAAADPTKHPALQPREIRIEAENARAHSQLQLAATKKKEETVESGFLRSVLQLVALIHAETPAGHLARAAMPEVIGQVTRLLEHPGLLLELRRVYLYESGKKKAPTPTEWLNQYVGQSTEDAKAGAVRADDTLLVGAAQESQKQALVAFRPAHLKDETDMARLLGIVNQELGEDYGANRDVLPTVAVIRSPGFQKLAKAVLAESIPPDKCPQNPLFSAPEVVQAIQKKHKLGEDAAVLHAQLLALPEPTTSNVGTWNGWTAARVKKAAAELAGQGLVLEASRARAGRSFFLPGEWIDLKAPWLPIERWKLDHLTELDLDPKDPCPAGGPMVLRPFEDLFASAWQRVVSGDAPGYEEVEVKVKGKKKPK